MQETYKYIGLRILVDIIALMESKDPIILKRKLLRNKNKEKRKSQKKGILKNVQSILPIRDNATKKLENERRIQYEELKKDLLTWFSKQQIFENIAFDDLKNKKLIILFTEVLKFLAKNQKIKKSQLDRIWDKAINKQTENYIRKSLFELITQLTKVINAELILHIQEKINKIKSKNYDFSILELLNNFTLAVLSRTTKDSSGNSGNTNINNESSSISLEKIDQTFGLQMMWDMIQEDSGFSQSLSSRAEATLNGLLSQPKFLQYRSKYIQLCIKNLQSHKSIIFSMQLIRNIIIKGYGSDGKKFRGERELFSKKAALKRIKQKINELNKKYKLFSLIIQEIEFYRKNAYKNSLKQYNLSKVSINFNDSSHNKNNNDDDDNSNSDDDDDNDGKKNKNDLTWKDFENIVDFTTKPIIGRFTHSEEITKRFNFLLFLLKYGGLNISEEQLFTLWDCLIKGSISKIEMNLMFNWLSQIRTNLKDFETDAIDDTEMGSIIKYSIIESLFEEKISKIKPNLMDLNYFKVFIRFFIFSNVKKNKLEPEYIVQRSHYRSTNAFLGESYSEKQTKKRTGLYKLFSQNLYMMDLIWEIILYTKDKEVLNDAIEFVADLYFNLGGNLNKNFKTQNKVCKYFVDQILLKLEQFQGSSDKEDEKITSKNEEIIIRLLNILIRYIEKWDYRRRKLPLLSLELTPHRNRIESIETKFIVKIVKGSRNIVGSFELIMHKRATALDLKILLCEKLHIEDFSQLTAKTPAGYLKLKSDNTTIDSLKIFNDSVVYARKEEEKSKKSKKNDKESDQKGEKGQGQGKDENENENEDENANKNESNKENDKENENEKNQKGGENKGQDDKETKPDSDEKKDNNKKETKEEKKQRKKQEKIDKKKEKKRKKDEKDLEKMEKERKKNYEKKMQDNLNKEKRQQKNDRFISFYLSQSKNFQLIFKLMNLSANISSKIWQILSLLPTNKQLTESFAKIDTEKQIPFVDNKLDLTYYSSLLDGNDVDMDDSNEGSDDKDDKELKRIRGEENIISIRQLFNKNLTPIEQLYRFQIIEMMLAAHPTKSVEYFNKYQSLKDRQWAKQFIKKNGIVFIIKLINQLPAKLKHFQSTSTTNNNNKEEKSKLVLNINDQFLLRSATLLMKIFKLIISEKPLKIEEEKEEDIEIQKQQQQQQQENEEGEEGGEGEEGKEGEEGEEGDEGESDDEFNDEDDEENEEDEELKKKKQLQKELKLVLSSSFLKKLPEMKKYFDNFFETVLNLIKLVSDLSKRMKRNNSITKDVVNFIKSSFVILQLLYKNKSELWTDLLKFPFEQTTIQLILKERRQLIRHLYSRLIQTLFEYTVEEKLRVQILLFFRGKLLGFLPQIDKIKTNSKEIYDLLIKSIELLPGKLLNEFLNTNGNLIQELIIKLKNYVGNDSAKAIDQNLKGLIGLLSILLSNDLSVEIKEQLESKFNLIEELYHICLFCFVSKRDYPKRDQFFPKCKNNETRKNAYILLYNLVNNSPKNLLKLSTLIERQMTYVRIPDVWAYVPVINQMEQNVGGYVGLRNQGATCYMNSVLQQLFMIPDFRNEIILSETGSKKIKDSRLNDDEIVLNQLKRMFRKLNEKELRYYDALPFCKVFKDIQGKPINVREQQDANEFLNVLFDKIEKGLKRDRNRQNLLNQIFGGTLIHQVICQEKNHISEREEPYFTISLEVKNKRHLKECLELFIQGDMLNGDNQYNCDQCDHKVDALKRCCIKDLPNYLILHLKRFEFDFQTMKNVKLNTFLEFPFEVNMKPYTLDGINERQREMELKKQQAEEQKQGEEKDKANTNDQKKNNVNGHNKGDNGNDDRDQKKIAKENDDDNDQKQKRKKESSGLDERSLNLNSGSDSFGSDNEDNNNDDRNNNNNEEDEEEEEYMYNRRNDDYYDYELTGIVIHSGTSTFGHYYSYIRETQSFDFQEKQNEGSHNGDDDDDDDDDDYDGGDFYGGDDDDDDEEGDESKKQNNQKKYKWNEFNDTRVSKFNLKKLPNACYGNDTSSNSKGKGKSRGKRYNAYMLVYKRKKLIPLSELSDLNINQNQIINQNEDQFNFGDEFLQIDDNTFVSEGSKQDNENKESKQEKDKDQKGTLVQKKEIKQENILIEKDNELLAKNNNEQNDKIDNEYTQFLEFRELSLRLEQFMYDSKFSEFLLSIIQNQTHAHQELIERDFNNQIKLKNKLISISDNISLVHLKFVLLYTLKILTHSQNKVQINVWFDYLTSTLKNSPMGSQWFFGTLLENTDLIFKLILECPMILIKDGIVKIISSAMESLSKIERADYNLMINPQLQQQRQTQEKDTDEGKEKGKEIKQDNSYENLVPKSLLIRFINLIILNLNQRVVEKGKKLTWLFQLLVNFAKIGKPEINYLIINGNIFQRCSNFLLSNYDQIKKIQLQTTQRRGSISRFSYLGNNPYYPGYRTGIRQPRSSRYVSSEEKEKIFKRQFNPLVELFEVLLSNCSIINSETSNDDKIVQEEKEKDNDTIEILSTDIINLNDFFKKLIIEKINVDALSLIFTLLPYNNFLMTNILTKICVKLIGENSQRLATCRYFMDYLSRMLQIDDSIVEQRISFIANAFFSELETMIGNLKYPRRMCRYWETFQVENANLENWSKKNSEYLAQKISQFQRKIN